MFVIARGKRKERTSGLRRLSAETISAMLSWMYREPLAAEKAADPKVLAPFVGLSSFYP